MFDDLRASWGARKPTNQPTFVNPARRTEFMAHYDGGAPLTLPTHADCLARVKQDQAFHMDGRGWSDIGYNGLVCQHGRAIEGRGIDYAGAHCPNHNTTAFGFQFMVGGSQAPTPAAYARMAELLITCEKRAGHTLRRLGHRDGFATDCPGNLIQAWVRAGMTTPAQEDDLSAAEVQEIKDYVRALVAANYGYTVGGVNHKSIGDVVEQTAAKVAALVSPAAPTLSAADIDAIATKVADLLAARLKS